MNLPELAIGSVNLIDVLVASGVAVGLFALLAITRRVALKHWGNYAESTANLLDDDLVAVLRRTQWWFLLVVGLFIGALYLDLPS